MLAAFYTATGLANDVLQVGERPTPQADAGEVRVRLKFSGVNPSDVKSRNGSTQRSTGLPLVIPHSDGAGRIDQVGPGIDPRRIGERVWVVNGQWQRSAGTAAQYIVLPEAQAIKLPDSIPLEVGACLGIPALTALAAVQLAHLTAGSTVLIAGGAGAVGHYAIQFAKLSGATVLSTVSSAEKAHDARQAGADHVIDYRTEALVERTLSATKGQGVDAIIEVDFSTNASADLAMLARYGRIVVYGAATDTATLALRQLRGLNATLHFMRVYDLPGALRTNAVSGLTDYLAQGLLQHRIAGRYSLADIAAAHDAVANGGLLGNVILELPD